MKNIKIIFISFIFVIFLINSAVHVGASAYTDFVPGVGVVIVRSGSCVRHPDFAVDAGDPFLVEGELECTFEVETPQGEIHTTRGVDVDKYGRGSPNISSIPGAENQVLQQPLVSITPLDSSPRHDQYFTEQIAPGHSLIGFTNAGQAYYTNLDAVNTLAPMAGATLVEFVIIAGRLAGSPPESWEDAIEQARQVALSLNISEGEVLTNRNLDVNLMNAYLASIGVDQQLANNTRGALFIRNNTLCPEGTTGTPPNCISDSTTRVCPEGTTGTPPNCMPIARVCPEGYMGIHPNCVLIPRDPDVVLCPSGYMGIHPNCVLIPRDPDVVLCPSGYMGIHPNCVLIPRDPDVVLCRDGYMGIHPNCVPIPRDPDVIVPGRVTPVAPPVPACFSFTTNRPRMLINQWAELRWNCSNVDFCEISPNIGRVGAAGVRNISPRITTTYSLTCYSGTQPIAPMRTTIEVFAADIREVR